MSISDLRLESAAVQALAPRISVHHLIACYVLFDIVALVLAGVSPLLVIPGLSAGEQFDLSMQVVFATPLLFLVVSRLIRCYNSSKILSAKFALGRTLAVLLVTFAILIGLGALTKTTQTFSRLWFFTWLASAVVLIIGARVLALMQLKRRMNAGACLYRAISIGVFHDPVEGALIADHTAGHVKCMWQSRLDGFDQLASLTEVVRRLDIDRIFVAVPWVRTPEAMVEVRSLQHLSADVMVLPGGSGVSESVVRISRFLHQPVFQAIERPIRDWDLWAKRALDVTLAGGALVLISPLMLLIALAIRIESRGPIIFRQIRGGMNGNTFELWKFRSMYADKADLDATVQTSKHDPRVTPVGRFIRRTSLDELPQLFNVLFGSMSLVGPRPHALNTRAQGRELEEVVDYYASRHRVKPGITGWAQVNGFRGELDTFDKVRQRVDLDLAYIEKWSLWLDVKILLRTFLLIVHDPRAY